jgi:PAP2 superfamily protein
MFDRVPRAVMTVLFVAGLCLAAQNAYFLRLAKTEYTLFTTLLSVTVLLTRLRHSLRDIAVLTLSTLAMLVIASRPDHFRPGVPLTLSVLGLASLAVLGVRAFWSSHVSRPILLWGFAASVALVSSGWVLPLLLTWVARSNPKSFDLYLLSFDASLRFQPSFAMGVAFSRWPVFGMISIVFYMGIICLCTLVYADHLKRNVKTAVAIFSAFLVSGPIGILFYNLFPARGPLYLFGVDFPRHPLPLDVIHHFHLEPVPVYGFPNAMPSLHMTWALLGFWYSRNASPWVRVVASFFLVFTICSTLGTGEHYLVDLVVAVPFALMIQAICAFSAGWANPWRIRSAVFGTAATILWMTLLRFYPGYFWVTPLTPLAMTATTTAVTLFIEKRLAEATQAGTGSLTLAGVNPGPIAALGSDAPLS